MLHHINVILSCLQCIKKYNYNDMCTGMKHVYTLCDEEGGGGG